jgi:hypothetical protein
MTQLQRHGGRFPTSGSSARIKAAVTKLKAARTYADPALTFLKNYTYDLGSDDLVELGALEYVAVQLTPLSGSLTQTKIFSGRRRGLLAIQAPGLERAVTIPTGLGLRPSRSVCFELERR